MCETSGDFFSVQFRIQRLEVTKIGLILAVLLFLDFVEHIWPSLPAGSRSYARRLHGEPLPGPAALYYQVREIRTKQEDTQFDARSKNDAAD